MPATCPLTLHAAAAALLLAAGLGTAGPAQAQQGGIRLGPGGPDEIELLIRRKTQPAPTPGQPRPAPEQDGMDLLLMNLGLLSLPPDLRLPQGTGKASELVVAAMAYLGRPYTWGGSEWHSGFDCSGFVQALHRQSAQVVLPRSAAEQAAATAPVERDELNPGDLVFFNTSGREFSHVGIYVGEQRFIHSPNSGSAIRLADLRQDYWNQRFNGGRRVFLADGLLPSGVRLAVRSGRDTPQTP